MSLFQHNREKYIADDDFRELQLCLQENPLAGSVIPGSGGCRKVRRADNTRQKGKRGGLRVIYYFRERRKTIYLMMIYSKGDVVGLSPAQLQVLKQKLFYTISNDK